MIYLNEEAIRSLLNWNDTVKATEAALKAVSSGKAVVSPRIYSQISTSKWMLTMPGYLDDDKYGGLACKVLTANSENANRVPPLPHVNVTVNYWNDSTGVLKAVFDGIEITNWRTAAASAVATKVLHTPKGAPQKILAVFGIGEQGRAHAECFYTCFQFEEIRIWNRTTKRATKVTKELNEKFNTTKFKVFVDKETCARGADVIVTTTSPSLEPVIKYEWLKKGIHINAVGVVGEGGTNEKHFELDEATYEHADVYVDNWVSVNIELAKLKEREIDMKAEIGEVLLGKAPHPNAEQLTVFQSLGMAVQDCAMARMIYDLHVERNQ